MENKIIRDKIVVFLFCLIAYVLLLEPVVADQGKSDYDPPFEIYGVVKQVENGQLMVFIPYIDKQLTVVVSPKTVVLDRLDKHSAVHRLEEIKVEDLVIIKGILEDDCFLSEEISFLSVISN